MHYTSLILSLAASSYALHECPHHDSYTVRNDHLGSSFGIANQNATYDYIVIGGGTAGNTIAARLAEDENSSVAVVEAGGFPWESTGNQTVVPAYCWTFEPFSDLSAVNPTVDWDLNAESQANLGGRSEHYTSPKAFGGGSSLNDMAYMRATEGTMNTWATLVNDPSYKWTNFLPFYKKATNYSPQLDVPDESPNFSPAGSPLQITHPPYRQPFNPFIKRAFERFGLKEQLGFNGGFLNGFGFFSSYLDHKEYTRDSSATAYLIPALRRTGLVAYPYTQAQKILFEGVKATGVIIQTAGQNYTLTAKREIILSAGFIHSPHILMLSGIGPAPILQSHSIPLIKSLPGVGRNWRDQPYVFATFQTDAVTGSNVLIKPALLNTARQEFIIRHSGPLSSPGADLIGWETFPESYRGQLGSDAITLLDSFPADWPHLEFVSASLVAGNSSQPENDGLLAMVVALMTSESVGSIDITSPLIHDKPILNANILGTTTDRELMLAGMKRLMELVNATGIVTKSVNPPSGSVQTDMELLEFINRNVVFGYHGSATCKMGNESDPMAVVDAKARVFGVKGLRVVDASVLPFCVPGHPSGTIYALAEKIAYDIKCGEGCGKDERVHEEL